MIGRFPAGKESCLSLVWAVLDLQINNTCNEVKLSDTSTARSSTPPPRATGNRGRGKGGARRLNYPPPGT
jgi:hypothetical protein